MTGFAPQTNYQECDMRRFSPIYISIISLIVLSACSTTSNVASYQQAYDEMMMRMKDQKDPFTAEEKLIMENAAAELKRSMPSPGLKVGTRAPDFTLRNAFAESITLSKEYEKGPVVLVFYRGAWCPFCNLHLHSLQKSLPEFKKYGAQLILVTPQTPDNSAEQIKKDDLKFEVLSDLDSQVMRNYKLYFELPDDLIRVYKKAGLDIEDFNGKGRTVLPVPGSFVIDGNGLIRAMQANTDYKIRMEPADIVAALKEIAED